MGLGPFPSLLRGILVMVVGLLRNEDIIIVFDGYYKYIIADLKETYCYCKTPQSKVCLLCDCGKKLDAGLLQNYCLVLLLSLTFTQQHIDVIFFFLGKHPLFSIHLINW